jgi:hypothetical protein
VELLFVTLGGAIIGIAARYAMPRRHTHGVTLLPAIGAAVAAVVWVGLTWLGWAWDGGWIWAVSLVASGVVPSLVALLIGRARERHDAELFTRISKTGLPARS